MLHFLDPKGRVRECGERVIEELVARILCLIYEIDLYGFTPVGKVDSKDGLILEIDQGAVPVVWCQIGMGKKVAAQDGLAHIGDRDRKLDQSVCETDDHLFDTVALDLRAICSLQFVGVGPLRLWEKVGGMMETRLLHLSTIMSWFLRRERKGDCFGYWGRWPRSQTALPSGVSLWVGLLG